MKSIIRVLTVVVFALGLLVPAHLGAQATNVTGEWAFTVTTDQGGGTPTITFKQDGEKLTGKYVGPAGQCRSDRNREGQRHPLHLHHRRRRASRRLLPTTERSKRTP